MNERVENMGERRVFFPRLYSTRLRRGRGPFDAVPFLNVLLLFVLFYLVQAPFVLRPGVRLDLPEAAFSDGVPFDAMVVTVSQEGMVFFNDQRTTLDGLQTAFRQAAYGRADPMVVIQADGRVVHRTLIDIYNKAMAAGIRRISLATRLAAPTEEPSP